MNYNFKINDSELIIIQFGLDEYVQVATDGNHPELVTLANNLKSRLEIEKKMKKILKRKENEKGY